MAAITSMASAHSAHASPAGQGEILGAAAVTGTCRPRSILTIATSLASRDRVPV
jgi:hypothetical protein